MREVHIEPDNVGEILILQVPVIRNPSTSNVFLNFVDLHSVICVDFPVVISLHWGETETDLDLHVI